MDWGLISHVFNNPDHLSYFTLVSLLELKNVGCGSQLAKVIG